MPRLFLAEVLQTSQSEPSFNELRAKQKHLFSCWYFASWNVRTLLDADSLMETKHSAESVISDERKSNQVIEELKEYNIYLAGLQETKWFGAEVYKVGLCCHQEGQSQQPERVIIEEKEWL